jgi:hypothetical protein
MVQMIGKALCMAGILQAALQLSRPTQLQGLQQLQETAAGQTMTMIWQ